jgi:hypothetical protein
MASAGASVGTSLSALNAASSRRFRRSSSRCQESSARRNGATSRTASPATSAWYSCMARHSDSTSSSRSAVASMISTSGGPVCSAVTRRAYAHRPIPPTIPSTVPATPVTHAYPPTARPPCPQGHRPPRNRTRRRPGRRPVDRRSVRGQTPTNRLHPGSADPPGDAARGVRDQVRHQVDRTPGSRPIGSVARIARPSPRFASGGDWAADQTGCPYPRALSSRSSSPPTWLDATASIGRLAGRDSPATSQRGAGEGANSGAPQKYIHGSARTFELSKGRPLGSRWLVMEAA